MATTTKTRPLKPVKVERSNNFSFQEYILNTLVQIQNNIKDLRNEIKDLRSETKTEIKDLRSETKTEISDLREETKTEISDLREEIRDLRTNITRVDGKMDSLQRWVVMAAITLFLGLLGMMTYLHNNLEIKIDRNTQAIQSIEKKLNNNTQAIHNIDKKLDRLIDRLPAK